METSQISIVISNVTVVFSYSNVKRIKEKHNENIHFFEVCLANI